MMKKDLYIASRWNEKNLKDAWAGTSYSLMIALSKIYSIKRIQVEPQNKWFKLINKLSHFFKQFLIVKFKLVSRHLNKKINNEKNTPVLIYPCAYNVKNKYFIYRDNSYEIYNYFKEIKEMNPWPWNNLSKIINTRLNLAQISKLENKIYEEASGIFFMGEWLAEYMKTRHPNIAYKIHAVGGGVNFDLNDNIKIQRSGNKILFVGKDFYRKGGPIVVKAFKILKQTYMPNAELHIVGPSKDLVENSPGIFNHGLIDFEEVKDIMGMCDVFCMPSYFEAYGIVFIEALCMGLPCIGRNCWEMPYFIQEGKTGELLKNESPEELAQLMLKILTNPEYTEYISMIQVSLRKKYSWQTVAERISSIIEKNK